jgi:hypothetical protein
MTAMVGRAAAGSIALILGAACAADRPDLIAEDGSIDVPCTPFADRVVEYAAGGGANDPEAASDALGAPDDVGVALAPDAVLTVGFLGLGAVTDADGADLGVAVAAEPAADAAAVAYVSSDGAAFTYAATLDAATTTIDLATAGASHAVYLRLVGQAETFSIDAVEAIGASCPAAN